MEWRKQINPGQFFRDKIWCQSLRKGKNHFISPLVRGTQKNKILTDNSRRWQQKVLETRIRLKNLQAFQYKLSFHGAAVTASLEVASSACVRCTKLIFPPNSSRYITIPNKANSKTTKRTSNKPLQHKTAT